MMYYCMLNYSNLTKFDNRKTKEVEMNKDDCIMHKLTCKKISTLDTYV
jgi:hypothetical protein